jgi:hypothetical protein
MLTALKYEVLILGAITALNQLGVNTASILTSVRVAGLTISFATRDALSNIISGLFIFWDLPFVVAPGPTSSSAPSSACPLPSGSWPLDSSVRGTSIV